MTELRSCLCWKSRTPPYVSLLDTPSSLKTYILAKADPHLQARILVSLATQQDKEVGDGTTSVVLLASELLRRANELIRNKIHPTTVIAGYRCVQAFSPSTQKSDAIELTSRLSCKEACRFMADQLSTKVDKLGKDALINVAKTSMSSKILAA